MLSLNLAPNHDYVRLVQIISDQRYPMVVGFFHDNRYRFNVTEDHLSDDGLTMIWLSNLLGNHQLATEQVHDIMQREVAKDKGLKLVANEVWFMYPIHFSTLEQRMKQLVTNLNQAVLHMK